MWIFFYEEIGMKFCYLKIKNINCYFVDDLNICWFNDFVLIEV